MNPPKSRPLAAPQTASHALNEDGKSFKMWMGYDVRMESFRPMRVEFWKETEFKNFKPQAPLHYQADALLGLSLFLLHPLWRGPHLPPHNSLVPVELWKAMEPHHQLFSRSQDRIQSLRDRVFNCKNSPAIEKFEHEFARIFESSLQPWGIDLTDLYDIVDITSNLEQELKCDLTYNFSITLNPSTTQRLHLLHSLLFNLRTLVAMDHNAYIQDPTHQAIQVDSVTDYLPRGEAVVNEVLLYQYFKKNQSLKPEVEQAFRVYLPDAICLFESLPERFLAGMKPELLEESLYLIQMDWLLGTTAGLLYRIREEISGLSEGYHQVFWPEVSAGNQTRQGDRLSVQCQLTEKPQAKTSEVA